MAQAIISAVAASGVGQTAGHLPRKFLQAMYPAREYLRCRRFLNVLPAITSAAA